MIEQGCEGCEKARKAWEIAWCWENQPDEYDWTADYDRGSECEAMWAAHSEVAHSGLCLALGQRPYDALLALSH